MAAYKNSVSRFAPLKLLDSKSVMGTIGEVTLRSMSTKAIMHPKPMTKLPITRGCLQPRLLDSTNP